MMSSRFSQSWMASKAYYDLLRNTSVHLNERFSQKKWQIKHNVIQFRDSKGKMNAKNICYAKFLLVTHHV